MERFVYHLHVPIVKTSFANKKWFGCLSGRAHAAKHHTILTRDTKQFKIQDIPKESFPTELFPRHKRVRKRVAPENYADMGCWMCCSSWSPLSYKKIPPENVDRICAININWNFIHPGRGKTPWKTAQVEYNLWRILTMKCQIWKQFFWLAFIFQKKKALLCFVSPSGIWRYMHRASRNHKNERY